MKKGPMKMKKASAIKITSKQANKLPANLVKAIKEKESSAMKMKKAAMKLKKDSAMMLKKSAMEMKKASAMKMKMKKKGPKPASKKSDKKLPTFRKGTVDIPQKIHGKKRYNLE